MNVRIESGTLYIGTTGTNANSIVNEGLRRAKEPPPIQYNFLSDAHILWTLAHLGEHLLAQHASIASLVKEAESAEDPHALLDIARRIGALVGD